MDEEPLALLRLLARLERISADSCWAHRASEARGSLLRVLERLESNTPVSRLNMKRLLGDRFPVTWPLATPAKS